MAGQLDEAAKQILGTLLADFTDRELSANDLKKAYEGPKIEVLATAVCNIDDITKVDFEVAFADLEKANLVKTGPMEAYKNKPGGSVFVIASFSKREYAYLTENGYKAARKAPNRPQRVQRVVNNVHISGGNFSNMQLAAGENVQQSMSVSSGVDSDIVSKLIAILEAQGIQVSDDQRTGIESAISEAEQGNAGTAKSFLAKVCGPMWESLQPVIWPIVGEVVKKSMGF
ncbi:hypothetical protein DVP60_10745 [Yersinia enterocolitica]|uniref:hypothetical protein n=1 Tax=Yersinia enterocolitica TaxID=630 RepID=UPI0003052311|nr:hypothetical protein [Yersinia enterocolitica]EKN3945946.1 hypothetical protein [Yersinia enterocolitica]EKN6316717.1 hypothetical protein [Yersinia enterocolitica]